MRNRHLGEQIVVIGNGPSVRMISPKVLRKHITMGVNEICRYFDPDYVVFADGPAEFVTVDPEMVGVRRAVRNCEVIRMAYPTWIAHDPEIVGIGDSTTIAGFASNTKNGFWDYFEDEFYEKLKGIWDEYDFITLPYVQSSVETAIMMAFYMGASRICLLGQDYYGDHFFKDEIRTEIKIGRPMENARADAMGLAKVARTVFSCEIVQLNPDSRIDTIPFGEL